MTDAGQVILGTGSRLRQILHAILRHYLGSELTIAIFLFLLRIVPIIHQIELLIKLVTLSFLELCLLFV